MKFEEIKPMIDHLYEIDYKSVIVRVIADSYNSSADSRITTFELEYPRIIHGEVKTHRVLSGNSQSSRAVPVDSIANINKNDIVEPLFYGKNKAGMSADEELSPEDVLKAREIWLRAAKYAFEAAEELKNLGLHKQWANRITEPFVKIKTVVTGTDWDNFYKLRLDKKTAQPEFVYLAQKMKRAQGASDPIHLKPNEWHLPYISEADRHQYNINELLKISASCCAQASYRKLDTSLEKAVSIYEKLFGEDVSHLSPTEHQAKAIDFNEMANKIQLDRQYDGKTITDEGITHYMIGCLDSDNPHRGWHSGNLRGFVQHRQLINKNGIIA